jgi:hypothetical protein
MLKNKLKNLLNKNHSNDIVNNDDKYKNIYLFDNLSDITINHISKSHYDAINDLYFKNNLMSTNNVYSYRDSIERGIVSSYKYLGVDLGIKVNFDTNIKYMALRSSYNLLSVKDNIDLLYNKDDFLDENKDEFEDIHTSLVKELSKIYDNNKFNGDLIKSNEELMNTALSQFLEEGKLISVLDTAKEAYAEVVKLQDKYSIRIGNGSYFVASDNIKVVMRDPSENPSWGIWFLESVPLSKIPDRAQLLFVPEEERSKYCPEEIPDMPIIVHASLWKLGENSGVLMHVSWHKFAATFKWAIKKPIEVASLLFKTASHPAHIIRNFQTAPKLLIPGHDFF